MKKLPRSTWSIPFALAALLLAAFVPPHDHGDEGDETKNDPSLSVERPGHGGPVCGLGKDFHAGRRAELMDRFEDRLLVFRGLPMARNYVKFSQDKVFWYLTGIESPGAALILDARTGRELLFLPAQDRSWEVWNGARWDVGDDFVGELSGFTEVREERELLATLEELLDGRKEVWTSLQSHVVISSASDQATSYDRARARDPLDGRPSREKAFAAALEE
ncbi:MAG: aminopeptidase P N-terminal domain-containing protein, partial [Planctomycetota bacterium]|nr:aminopeptidase P N-terminal domain-containing protein [Planctomycetota bacterium]